jgi:predicted O-methyltransferase YrrM
MSTMMPDLERYFGELVPPRDALLLELEREARAEGIPIIGPVVGELLSMLVCFSRARRVLELGTATGYSAIYLARACEVTGGRLITVEWDGAMAERARANLAKAGLRDRVEVRVGDALRELTALQERASQEEPFDLIFMDIDKEGYAGALPLCRVLLRVGGLLLSDNVGFQSADPFNRSVFQRKEWRSVHLLSYLPGHSPEKDGLSLALRVS